MNANATAWVAALRSGDYKQTKNRLHDGTGYCCLGVACDLAVKAGVISPPVEQPHPDIAGQKYYVYAGEKYSLPLLVGDWLGLCVSDGSHVTSEGLNNNLPNLNDIQNKSFGEIADIIEAEAETMFV